MSGQPNCVYKLNAIVPISESKKLSSIQFILLFKLSKVSIFWGTFKIINTPKNKSINSKNELLNDLYIGSINIIIYKKSIAIAPI